MDYGLSNEEKTVYDAQLDYCMRTWTPIFVSPNGKCPNCRQRIFLKPYGITIERASSELIRGCPYCYFSFCE